MFKNGPHVDYLPNKNRAGSKYEPSFSSYEITVFAKNWKKFTLKVELCK